MDELRCALELATDNELEQLTHMLFTRRFNPLDYWQNPTPSQVQNQDHESWLDTLETRFRYLAADSLTVLQGRSEQFSYRQTLVRVCQYLKIPYSQSMETTEIEAEVFLHLLEKAWQSLPPQQKQFLNQEVKETLSAANIQQVLPPGSQTNLLPVLLKNGGALAVNSLVKSVILQQIARKFAYHLASYQAAKSYLALKTAQKGMVMSAARYGSVKTVFAFLGPMLWTCLIAELGWQAIATNYGRIIPVIFTLAQIRLTRSEPWLWQAI